MHRHQASIVKDIHAVLECHLQHTIYIYDLGKKSNALTIIVKRFIGSPCTKDIPTITVHTVAFALLINNTPRIVDHMFGFFFCHDVISAMMKAAG